MSYKDDDELYTSSGSTSSGSDKLTLNLMLTLDTWMVMLLIESEIRKTDR